MLTRVDDAAQHQNLVWRERETAMGMTSARLVLSVGTTTVNNSGLSSTTRTTAA